MRMLRNVSIALFLLSAIAAASGTADGISVELEARASECTIVQPNSMCTQCGGDRPNPVCWIPVDDSCSALDCSNESNSVFMCEGDPPTAGQEIKFCTCTPCS